jgi:anaerobic dimethyl sulfoxide reductase subunit A
LRGRAYRQRLYHPDRLKKPLKRVGERGEGKFREVSWGEALDMVASELRRVKDTYGNAAIVFLGGSGSQGVLHGPGPVRRLLSDFGGYTRYWGSPSMEAAIFASMATYGTITTGHTRDDMLNTRLMILWGWNPADTIFDTTTSLYVAKAKEGGTKVVSVDPKLTNTSAVLCQQWIPIRPGTDTAVLVAMAYTILNEGLQDQAFLDTYTIGAERYKDYLFGHEDGIPKTPTWAARISGVPADTIQGLAVEYATLKPAMLIPGWGPGRTALGEQYHRAADILCALTGNIGIHGGFAGGMMRGYESRKMILPGEGRNPVEQGFRPRPNSLHQLRGGTNPTSARFHNAELYDVILKGPDAYPWDIRLAYIVALNVLNSFGNVNKGIEAFKKLEFIVVHEQFMTPTAKFADVVLPINTFFERNDIATPWLGAPYYIYLNKAIDPMYESKSDFEICVELAKRLGIENFMDGKTEDDLLRDAVKTRDEITDYARFKKEGVHKVRLSEPLVAFKSQIEDPENNPFPTPSGKIEIYSQLLADMNNPLIPPVPQYLDFPENHRDQLAKRYPLQLLTTHPKGRAHGTWANVRWLNNVDPQVLWINTDDAEVRGIRDSDKVIVFNDRGKVVVSAKVTQRIMPGVVDLPEGAWFDFDEQGIDHGGCANVLTKDAFSPGGAVTLHTSLVQVQKFGEGR